MSLVNKSQAANSVIPAIAARFFKTFGPETFASPKAMVLNSMVMFHGLRSVYEESIEMSALVPFMQWGIEETIKRNRDIKEDCVLFNPEELIDMAKRVGYITVEDDVVTLTTSWIELNSNSTSLAPQIEHITESNRRIPYVKGDKRRPSKMFTRAVEHLQDRAYHVELPMLSIINQVVTHFQNNSEKLPDIVKDELYVLMGSNKVADYTELFSEWKGDNRGRYYHAACFGPNPQSGDMARALDSNNVESIVKKDSAAYEFFALEMEECAGGDWSTERFIRYTATRPVDALIKIINKVQAGDKNVPAKPYMYVRMCLDWVKFQDNGECDCRISFGEDAKCSGTQILAILAGNEELMEATGLIKEFTTKPADPYIRCLGNIKNRVVKSKFAGMNQDFLTRNFSKRPYMQVQYSGGVKSLVNNADFKRALENVGITGANLEDFAKLTIEAVWDTLGERITGMIDAVKAAVLNKCEELGKPYFEYVHIDGFKVRKPCFVKIEVCAPFKVRYDASTQIILGNLKDNKKWTIKGDTPDLDTFVRTFIVNFVQGIDALIARTVSVFAKEDGLRAFTSIHDCFRCSLADAPLMHKTIARAYKYLFIENNIMAHLEKQIGTIPFQFVNKLTEEVLDSEQAYFFTAH